MAVLRESPWYQEIEQRGIQQGIEQGIEQGARRLLMRVLQQRFGEIPREVAVKLEGESVEKLESLTDSALVVNSLAEFLRILSTRIHSLPK